MDESRFWSMIERHKVTIFYTAPTAIRTFMRLGEEHPKKHDLSSLRLLGTVGEPINPQAWLWYNQRFSDPPGPPTDPVPLEQLPAEWRANTENEIAWLKDLQAHIQRGN